MKNELTTAQIKIIQKAGFLPDMSIEDISQDPEGDLWLIIRNSGAKDILEYATVIADETGWDAEDANSYARSTWKTARKLIASK